MSFFLHLRAGVVGTKVHIFVECLPEIPLTAFRMQETMWTSHEHPFLEVRSMPQASLTEYFLKHYKGGGVFQHDAYGFVTDEWCWIHKSSGIKARPL